MEPYRERIEDFMRRHWLQAAILVGIVLLMFAASIVVRLTLEIPSVVVCDRRAPNIEVKLSSTRIGGYFEEHRVGPCVAYIHKSRNVGD